MPRHLESGDFVPKEIENLIRDNLEKEYLNHIITPSLIKNMEYKANILIEKIYSNIYIEMYQDKKDECILNLIFIEKDINGSCDVKPK